jgi:hypothetical protein
MVNLPPGAPPPPPPAPMQVGPTQLWAAICGAIFGGVTLAGFFVIAFVAGNNPEFVCNGYTPLAAVFAFGAALSAGFIGGAAALAGNLGSTARNNALTFSAGGGIAVLFIGFLAFIHYKGDVCKQADLMNTDTARIIKLLREKDISITATTTHSEEPVLRIVTLRYNSVSKGERVSAPDHAGVFTIPWKDVLEADPGIEFGYDDSKQPAQWLERGHGPPPISIERLEYSTYPPRIKIFLTFPRITDIASSQP